MKLSVIDRCRLQRIASRTCVQGDHKERIIDFYLILARAADEEFREDNHVTLTGFLDECHKAASEIVGAEVTIRSHNS